MKRAAPVPKNLTALRQVIGASTIEEAEKKDIGAKPSVSATAKTKSSI